MTIGRPQGAVWIGKPLDMAIPLSLDPGEGGDSLCAEADVIQGDTRMADRSVTVSLEPGASAGSSRLRIRSTSAIEETVVVVNVRAGCDTKSSRSYTLLADVPLEVTPPGVIRGGEASAPAAVFNDMPRPGARELAGSGFGSGAGGSTGVGTGAGATDGSGTPTVRSAPTVRRSNPPAPRPSNPDAQPVPRRATAPAPAPAPERRAAVAPPAPVRPRAPVVAAAPAPAPAPAVRAPAAAEPRRATTGAPRLQVDAVETAPVAAAQAGLKTELALTLPASAPDPAKRAEAAAQWRSLNADPEAAQRESQRIQAMESNLTALREQTAQNQRTLLELRNELADARENRYRNPVVYGLAALVLLLLLALALMWRTARRAPAGAEWWGQPAPGEGNASRRIGPLTDEDLSPASERSSANSTSFGAAGFANVEADLDHVDDVPVANLARTPDGALVRPVNTEELFDVQQQSDFFLSLGQHEQAIAVLREHIADNPGTSALAYLDLLRIFHSLGYRDEYGQVAAEFERAFNADVPAFDSFNEGGKGLEHYRSALARIESQWPAPGTLALIEELIFRKPGALDDEAFDLAAYQELLLLYSVAKEVIDPDSAPPAPVTPHSFVDTFSHEEMQTSPAALTERETPPEPVHDGPMLPPSMYSGIDDHIQHADTAPLPHPPIAGTDAVWPATQPPADVNLAEFDRTAYETMRADVEPSEPQPAPAPARDPHTIDFELFDPQTEAEIAPRPVKR